VVIVGDGPARAGLEAAVAAAGLRDVVHFAGAVPDARPLVGAFDLVLGPSRAEGLPNSVLEAAAAGRAVAATRAGGTPEILTDGETGLLVPAGDPPALRDALDRLAADADLRARLGAAARADVGRRFGIDRMVAETAELYEHLLAASGRP
jgi:glycosyltransferase involved in cell wall biosynthesis